MYPIILIVDDEPTILKSFSGILEDEGFETVTAQNGYEALQKIEETSPDLVLLDIWMPGMDGIATLKEIKKAHPHIPVIMVTGHGTIETAVNATKIGAFDFIEKPINIDRVLVAISNALNFRKIEEENRYLRKKTIEKYAITGNSPAMQEVKKQVMIAGPTDAWVLIAGENGTGKELVARTLHQLSKRAERPLVAINCAVLSDERIESVLFGHEKGAFPGADTRNRGKLELVSGGTLFLDEIGELGEKGQALLLRVLEEKKFQRIGGTREIEFDARVIATTNRNLEKAIENGGFKKELYYRLNVVPIKVPPLRERIEDIPDLVDVFLAKIAEENRTPKKRMDKDALDLLCQYPWPGNVRELKNLIERLDIMVSGDVIRATDIPYPYNPRRYTALPGIDTQRIFSLAKLKDAKKAFEQAFTLKKLAEHDYDPVKTAQAIGADRRFVEKVMKKVSRNSG